MTPDAEDFLGLLYNFLGKGDEGMVQLNWFKESLLKPFANSHYRFIAEKMSYMRDYKKILRRHKNIKNNLKRKFSQIIKTR